MSKKKSLALLAGISFALVCFVILFEYEGNSRKIETLYQCVALFSLISLFLSGILVFRPIESFQRWFRFARIFIPITTLLSTFSSFSGSDLMSMDGESLAFFFAFLYAVISIVRIRRGTIHRAPP